MYAPEPDCFIAYVIAKEEGVRVAREEEARRASGVQREFEGLDL